MLSHLQHSDRAPHRIYYLRVVLRFFLLLLALLCRLLFLRLLTLPPQKAPSTLRAIDLRFWISDRAYVRLKTTLLHLRNYNNTIHRQSRHLSNSNAVKDAIHPCVPSPIDTCNTHLLAGLLSPQCRSKSYVPGTDKAQVLPNNRTLSIRKFLPENRAFSPLTTRVRDLYPNKRPHYR